MNGGQTSWQLEEADDPTDWNESYSFLRSLDSSLRCELCFNILTAPVAVKDCNHVFCSVCVRSAINQPDPHGKHCPKCMRKDVHDSSLVPQPIIENAAEAWKLARPELVKKQASEVERIDQGSSSRPSLSPEIYRPSKRAKRGNGSSERDQLIPQSTSNEDRPAGRVTRSGSHRGATQVATDNSIVIESDTDEDGAYEPGSSGSVIVKTSQSREDGKDYRSLQATDLAACPLCDRKVTLSVLNQHLDKGCEASESIQSPRNGITSAGKGNWFQKPIKVNAKTSNAPRSKLPRPNYGVMKEAEIRKMLADLQLSKNGSKDRIVERHRQWVTLYNANLDASPKVQKTDLQLRRELAEWDRAFDESQRKTKPMNEEAAKVYQEVNQGQFNDLIKTARETHAKNKAAHHQKGTQEEQTSNGSQSKPSSSSPTG